ncbi:hypothetical protein MD588_00925 [Photobacterium sp. SDRW27]|uniref:hypothetical protein n=1 Tax=Photobacterium obscurum TaxID=2829490 RepID=UPI002244D7D8|nr:hypothetical protein [Photobacterium obscurum]MCW8327363.1 hypothetical protein [Photobacterium obscurum]
MNHLNALRRKLQKKKSKFIAEHEFKGADVLQLSREELDNAVELNKIISVMLHGKLQFPAFQFDSDGHVYSALQDYLPRLLEARSNWDICFWLFTVQSITLKRAIPNAAMLRGISIEEMVELGKQAAEQTERYAGKPIDAATSGNSEVFAACVEHLLNPDYRVIPHN